MANAGPLVLVSPPDRVMFRSESTSGAHISQILDLFAQDDRLNVYAGELAVRPPDAPTTPSCSGP
jgi:hypothetical protein